jgi:hypothetical protein
MTMIDTEFQFVARAQILLMQCGIELFDGMPSQAKNKGFVCLDL